MIKIAVIGLGYVGLPLAVALAKQYDVTGFDTDNVKIEELKKSYDRTKELSEKDLAQLKNIKLSSQNVCLKDCTVYLVTVPTPILEDHSPDLDPLRKASKTIGQQLTKGDTVIYESTVYPGLTEEVCVPILEEFSRLRLNEDFGVGYSPERINPGDKTNRLQDIVKVVSASNTSTLALIDRIYSSIIDAGTHRASSIKVAEAAKVIENTQRDLNIALVNELSKIFQLLEIDTSEVLDAAATKWNFIKFKPGLVGGHCIGIDPYYLTYKAKQVGYEPEVILAGRRINDNMASFIVSNLVKLMLQKSIGISNRTEILILGVTFKENCPDTRNSKVLDIIDELLSLNMSVRWHDPWCEGNDPNMNIELRLDDLDDRNEFDACVLAVPHKWYAETGVDNLKSKLKPNGVFLDLKSLFDANKSDWRL